jgi:hypothetical protein
MQDKPGCPRFQEDHPMLSHALHLAAAHGAWMCVGLGGGEKDVGRITG